jgi:hypothetical protein
LIQLFLKEARLHDTFTSSHPVLVASQSIDLA